MAVNKPDVHLVHPKDFVHFMTRKTTKNDDAVADALRALISVTLDEKTNIGVELTDNIIAEATEALVDVLLQHGIGTCRPTVEGKTQSDDGLACWQYDPRGVMRCECYDDACPVALWHKENNKTLLVKPLDDEDLAHMNPDANVCKVTPVIQSPEAVRDRMLALIDDEMADIEAMPREPDENEASFNIRKLHWSSAMRSLRIRVKTTFADTIESHG